MSSSTLSPPSSTLHAPASGSVGSAVAVVIAASLAMACTLPGRTHGLGLITTRLLADFPELSETAFAQINLIATLLGSLFCLPCGWLLDRYGARPVLGAVMLSLGGTVMAMSHANDSWSLAVAITLTRGIGQSMLSVVSIVMISKWFRSSAGLAMGSYAVVMTVFMAAGTGVLAMRVTSVGWRLSWWEVSVTLLVVTPVAWLLALRPAQPGAQPIAGSQPSTEEERLPSDSFAAALNTSCFWIFALGVSLFGMVSSGVTLFQQLILAERGLSESVYHAVLIIGLIAGMAANLTGGWLSRKFSMARLLAVALILLAGSLAALPLLELPWHAYVQAIVAGIAGGLITVLFFSVWSHAYGAKHLGRIQGLAQMMTVLASAAGPLLVAEGKDLTGSYFPVLYALAGAAAFLAAIAATVTVPCAARGDWSVDSDIPAVLNVQETSA